MRKISQRIMVLGLAVAMCLGATAILNGASVGAIVSDAAEGYYAPITATGGNALLGQLHDLITTTHTTYTSYGDCRDYAPTTDPGQDGKGIIEFYTHETVLTFVGGTGGAGYWNREHVWCQSLSNGLWGTSGGGSDLHHIRPTELSLNGSRGNKKYGNVPNGQTVYSKNTSGANSMPGGTMNNGMFEPLDNVKGDVARIVMYVYTHYNTYGNVYGTTNGNGKGFGTLKFTNVISASDEAAAKKLLLDWNKSDPVDEIEIYRNTAVYKIQGNRNPFIDHPEYAEAIWGEGTVKPDPSVEEFHTIVAGIPSNGSLQARYASIGKAIAAYRALTEAEKALAEEDIEILRTAVDDYGQTVSSYNTEAKTANEAALNGLGGLFHWIGAFIKFLSGLLWVS